MQRHPIPLIDIAPFFDGSESEKQAVAKQIGRACQEIGFFTIAGHGIPDALMYQVNDLARQFFDLSLADKKAVQDDKGMGYIPMEGENLGASLDDNTLKDVKESLNLMLPVDLASWPEQPDQLILICQQYLAAMIDLASDLMALFALALDLPADFFADNIEPPRAILRLLNYPATTVGRANAVRAAEHTDYGTLTILWARHIEGLQVLNRDGQWLDVEVTPGVFVINIGDLMMNWTNDRWISTLHRVVSSKDGPTQRRQSIAFFHNPNPEALIECLASCYGADNPPKYQPILARDHLNMKIAKALGGS